VLSNCAWFLYETSDYSLSLHLVDIGLVACEDRESLQYATLCMIAGSVFYELNQLSECRKNWEIFMAIQEASLPPGHLELSNSYHNMGNLEAADSAAADSLEKATTYFESAISIRVAHDDTANSLLANSYLCMSRVYFLKKEYEEALTILGRSEALFYRLSGADAHFMAQYDLQTSSDHDCVIVKMLMLTWYIQCALRIWQY
jgi:tetratricopeptide (TPR) repeat protein